MIKLTNLRFFLLFFSFLIFAGCQPQKDYSEELKPLVDKYNAAWESGNVDGLEEIFAPDFVRHADASTSAEGIDELKKVIKDFKTAFPDLKLISEEEIYTKNTFTGRWSISATNTGPGEMPPTGKSVNQWGINIIHFKDGKITEEWDGFDNQMFLEQLGYTLTPPELINN